MSNSQQPLEVEERNRISFNFLAQIKKSAGTTPRSSKAHHVEDVSILSAGSDGKRLEAAGSTPSLKKMNAGSASLLVPNFTNLTESMSEDSSGFDMNHGANLALFRDRYPVASTSSNESEMEIQFQSDLDSEEDQTWSAPFAAVARVVEKNQFQHQKMEHVYHREDVLLQNRSVDEVEKIWKDAEFAARSAIPLLPQQGSQQPIVLGSPQRRLLELPPPPPPPMHYSASEEQSLIQIESSPTAQSTTSSSSYGVGSNALLDEDTLAGDDYTYDDTTVGDEESFTDGDTYGDETITLDDDDADNTLAGETLLDNDTYRGSMGILEAFLEELADVNPVGGRLGGLLFPGCGGEAANRSGDDEEDEGTITTEVTRLEPSEKKRIGSWVGVLTVDGGSDKKTSVIQTQTSEVIPTEELTFLARLKQSLSLSDDSERKQRQSQSFLGSFFSCNG